MGTKNRGLGDWLYHYFCGFSGRICVLSNANIIFPDLHEMANEIEVVSFLDEEILPENKPFPDSRRDFGRDGRLFGRGRRVNAALVDLWLFDMDEGFGKNSDQIAVFRFKSIVPGERYRGRCRITAFKSSRYIPVPCQLNFVHCRTNQSAFSWRRCSESPTQSWRRWNPVCSKL